MALNITVSSRSQKALPHYIRKETLTLHRCISGDEMTMKSYPVNIIVGSRYDRYKSFNPRAGELKAERLSPRAAISVSPTDWLMMYGSISSAFRAPTMAEMYRDDVHFTARVNPITGFLTLI